MSATWPRCPNGGKVCYPSAAKARKYARLSHDLEPQKAFRIYICPTCGSYHLTKQRNPNERTTCPPRSPRPPES